MDLVRGHDLFEYRNKVHTGILGFTWSHLIDTYKKLLVASCEQ